MAVRCPAAVIVDHLRTTAPSWSPKQDKSTCSRQLEADLAVSAVDPCAARAGIVEEDANRRCSSDGVERIHEHLHAGDIFQVNLSRAWRARFAEAPASSQPSLYVRYVATNPAPFAGLLQYNDWAVVSSSPERLVEVRRGVAQTRPIAGTRPRFAGDDDLARIRELSAHPKERAEHVMLVDLERNDLGRVCRAGLGRGGRANGGGELRACASHRFKRARPFARRRDAGQKSSPRRFPGGTITGCPKVRCMEIIASLEDTPRGAYTGALGYLDRNGDLDLNILIRTLDVANGASEPSRRRWHRG